MEPQGFSIRFAKEYPNMTQPEWLLISRAILAYQSILLSKLRLTSDRTAPVLAWGMF
jgi:hypothetical protein